MIWKEVRKGTLAGPSSFFEVKRMAFMVQFLLKKKLFCMNVLLFFWSCKTSKWQRDWWHISYYSKRNAGKAINGWQFWHLHILQHLAGVHIKIHNVTKIGHCCLSTIANLVISESGVLEDFSLNAVANYFSNSFETTNQVQVWGNGFEHPLGLRLWKVVMKNR